MGDAEPVCIDDEIPFELPDGWAWARLGAIFHCFTGSTPSTKNPTFYGNEYPFYKPSDLDAGYYVQNAKSYLTESGLSASKAVQKDSVLVTCIGATIGKTGLARKHGSCNQQINVISATDNANMRFVYYCMKTSFVQEQIKARASATTLPILNLTGFNNLLIPLPPKEEQNQIASTVEMVFESIAALELAQSRLESLLVNTRSKILDLAIRGKLVPQDPADEPASILLERIRQEKLRMVAEGKLKKKDIAKDSVIYRGDDNSYYEKVGDTEPVCIDDEIPFELPDDWTWARASSLFIINPRNDTCDSTCISFVPMKAIEPNYANIRLFANKCG